MLKLSDLTRPIIGAPMAGGPTTPQLVAAVGEAGGFGMLAAGYLDADQLRERLRQVRLLTDRDFGVNLFVPGSEPSAKEHPGWDAYRDALGPVAERLGVDLPSEPRWHDDHYSDKLAVIRDNPPAVVSFTFGLPAPAVVDWLHSQGTACWVTVTSPSEAAAATARGADALCVQGPEAGGHRGTFDGVDPAETPLPQLLGAVKTVTDLPLAAAGGVRHHQDVAALLRSGADAVQVGTALLGAFEAGTKAAHLEHLRSNPDRGTVVTRAFTGRPARAMANDFTARHADPPALYPQLHYLTAPLRAAAAACGDTESLNLWAGTGYAAIRCAPAAQIVEMLSPPASPEPRGTSDPSSRDTGRARPSVGAPGWVGGIDGVGGPDGRPDAVTLGVVGLGRRGLAILDQFVAEVRSEPELEFSLAAFHHGEALSDRAAQNTHDAAMARFLRQAPPNLAVKVYRADVARVAERDGIYDVHFDDLLVPCSRVVFCDPPSGYRWPLHRCPEQPAESWEEAPVLAPMG
ncbi:MAG: nitronate monooxygenase [Bifidobacteriaceae bacterium]|nr:nitronate monooxygenase [Bifidobacteriaceae bacterium]